MRIIATTLHMSTFTVIYKADLSIGHKMFACFRCHCRSGWEVCDVDNDIQSTFIVSTCLCLFRSGHQERVEVASSKYEVQESVQHIDICTHKKCWCYINVIFLRCYTKTIG